MLQSFQTGRGTSCPVFYFFQRAIVANIGVTDRIYNPKRSSGGIRNIVATKNLNTKSDVELVTQMGGDPDALACLYDRYGSLVYAVALRVLKDTMAAEDIVNDVFLQLWRNPAGFDERRGKLASWLTVITRNRAVDHLRRRKPGQDVAIEDAPPAQIAISRPQYFAADFDKAQRVMNALPKEQRTALELAYLDGLTQSEISTKLGEPLGTVKSRIRLGLMALKKALA